MARLQLQFNKKEYILVNNKENSDPNVIWTCDAVSPLDLTSLICIELLNYTYM